MTTYGRLNAFVDNVLFYYGDVPGGFRWLGDESPLTEAEIRAAVAELLVFDDRRAALFSGDRFDGGSLDRELVRDRVLLARGASILEVEYAALWKGLVGMGAVRA